MCGGLDQGGQWHARGVSRRRFLAAGAAGIVLLGRVRPAAAEETVDLDGLAVIPRASWGGDLAPRAPIPAEPEVRYLLVHHSVDPGNDYAPADVARILRGFVAFHTSSKGWPDLAYNFMVDRFGRVWEGRTGSLAGPVAGDATGGNQGYDQLCCFVGNHQAGQPSAEAFAAMSRLLAVMARRYGVPLGPGATTSFTSRGSNLHPAGTVVTTPTIAGHRDMSRTQCPGDLVAARLGELRLLAAGGAGTARPAPLDRPTSTTAPPPPAVASTAPPAGPASTAPPAPSSTAPPTTPAPARPGGGRAAGAGKAAGTDGVGPAAAVAAVGVAAAAAAGGGTWARRRRRPEP
ncbi:MAG: N-acetylmuramoyl-L-alanine amidase [Actinomycetota bacterium]